ncbi:MAG: class I SAM-dependent methyltransferase [Chitinispirillaceae bacterium]|nr:class I SAM-dependent methyltransferase [Chitinispirillaceae bacterium]
MITDPKSNYTSPAGKEFSMAAARISGVNAASHVLDIGCGYGESACRLAADFRCKVTAVDASEENITMAKALASERRVSHLITFETADIQHCDFSKSTPDLVLAEGGILSFLSRKEGLRLAASWLQQHGWLAFSDMIFLSDKVPEDVRVIFEDDKYHYESEHSYRALVNEAGFDVHFMSLVPPSGWDNYYAHMARRLEYPKGFFADKNVRLAFHREIDIFYRLEGFRFIGYLFCMARKK